MLGESWVHLEDVATSLPRKERFSALFSLHRDGSDLRMLERFTGSVLHESLDGVGTGRRGRRPGVRHVQCLLWCDILARL